MAKHVLVLMGGRSAEREVSLTSGRECAAALREAGYRVGTFDADRPVRELIAALEAEDGPDTIFNALHGRYGEDGTVQGLFDLMGVPYTHSGILASAVAMDKPMAKQVLAAAGLPTVPHIEVDADTLLTQTVIPLPFVVKPSAEGSSVRVHIVKEGDNRLESIAAEMRIDARVMVERYVPGREFTVAVLGGKALAVTEIVPKFGFYDYEAKYSDNADRAARHAIPAEIPEALARTVMDMAERAHVALGCRGVSRADFRYDESQGEKGLIILEVNTQPGMTPVSLVPEQAAFTGMPFPELCAWLVENATCDG